MKKNIAIIVLSVLLVTSVVWTITAFQENRYLWKRLSVCTQQLRYERNEIVCPPYEGFPAMEDWDLHDQAYLKREASWWKFGKPFFLRPYFFTSSRYAPRPKD